VPAGKEEPEVAPEEPGVPPANEDWPIRYSWLDEEPAEPQEPAESRKPAESREPAESQESAGSGDAKPSGAGAATAAEPTLAGEPTVPVKAVVPEGAPADSGSAENADVQPSAAEPPATAPGGQPSDTGLVTVVRGVPRFHQADCVLVRFMAQGDTQQVPIAEARSAGCTPCAACQPEG